MIQNLYFFLFDTYVIFFIPFLIFFFHLINDKFNKKKILSYTYVYVALNFALDLYCVFFLFAAIEELVVYSLTNKIILITVVIMTIVISKYEFYYVLRAYGAYLYIIKHGIINIQNLFDKRKIPKSVFSNVHIISYIIFNLIICYFFIKIFYEIFDK